MSKKLLCNLFRDQGGSVVVIVALFMTFLIGLSAFVLDIGFAYNIKSDLQKDLDSIALAAVRELPAESKSSDEWKNAVANAKKYAELNGIIGLSEANINEIREDPMDSNSRIIGIKINDKVKVNYNFANIIGFKSGDVICDATAMLKPADGVSGLLPLALPIGAVDYLTGKTELPNDITLPSNLTLKLGPKKMDDVGPDDARYWIEKEFTYLYSAVKSDDIDTDVTELDDKFETIGTGGWRGAIYFSTVGNPKGKYSTCMKDGGCKEQVNIGDEVELRPGTITINHSKLEEEKDYPVPIIDYKDGKLQVVGFATVRIKVLTSESGIKMVEVEFVSKDLVASGVSEKGMVENYYGVLAARLVD